MRCVDGECVRGVAVTFTIKSPLTLVEAKTYLSSMGDLLALREGLRFAFFRGRGGFHSRRYGGRHLINLVRTGLHPEKVGVDRQAGRPSLKTVKRVGPGRNGIRAGHGGPSSHPRHPTKYRGVRVQGANGGDRSVGP